MMIKVIKQKGENHKMVKRKNSNITCEKKDDQRSEKD